MQFEGAKVEFCLVFRQVSTGQKPIFGMGGCQTTVFEHANVGCSLATLGFWLSLSVGELNDAHVWVEKLGLTSSCVWGAWGDRETSLF